MSNKTIENYNNLVPFMNDLEEQGIRVDDFHSNSEGYGFYTDGENNHYVQVNVWGPEMRAALKRRNGDFYHSITDPIIKDYKCSTIEDVKKSVLELLDYSKTQMRHYKVELNEAEVNYLIKTCSDQKIVHKLKNYLQNK